MIRINYISNPVSDKPEVADFGLIKAWLEFCRRNHTRLCGLQKPAPLPGLQVTDCETRRIAYAAENLEYLALSYVWGSMLSGEPNNIPQVINDAIEMTRKLQYRYLWVDRCCSTQDNHDEKHVQIRLMGVLVAAGIDSNFGLPGAGFRNRQWQPNVIVKRHTLCSTPPDPKFAISRSKWMRLIFFTESQRLRPEFHSGLFQPVEREIDPWKVWETVKAYPKRPMTYDINSLNGILGILALYENLENLICYFWGVPIFPPTRYKSGTSTTLSLI
ncbi:hypothetical protein V2W45_1520575 [Cenococcum geophilum]